MCFMVFKLLCQTTQARQNVRELSGMCRVMPSSDKSAISKGNEQKKEETN